MKHRTTTSRFAVCVKNRGFAASLELRKIYRTIPDAVAESRGLIRVVDESGEDYLFPKSYFVDIELPAAAAHAITAAI